MAYNLQPTRLTLRFYKHEDGNAHVYKQAEKYAAIATAAPVAQLSEPPEGWVLVPIEPTPKMIDATFNHTQERDGLPESHNTRNKRIWRAMLSAAPTTPKE